MRPAPLLFAVLCSFLVAGCAGGSVSNGPDGQKAIGKGSIAYNGASTGTDRTEFPCGDTGEVVVGSNLGSGRVKVTVKDSTGAVVYSKTLGSPGQAGETKTIHGAAGNGWLVIGEREATSAYGVSGFSGQYSAQVQC